MNRLSVVERAVAPGWYPLGLAGEFSRTPRRFLVGRTPLVAFEDDGKVSVLLDRCPHRNAPLSDGRVVDGRIECPYHGWTFDGGGQCVLIPGRSEPPKPSHCVPAYPTVVHQGIVFVGFEVAEGSQPFQTEEQNDPRYVRLVRKVSFPGSVFAVVENALDVPHTTVLHRGLFRSGSRRKIRVHYRRYASWLEAEYVGETLPRGLVSRMLAGGRAANIRVEHFDRFFLPGVLQVEYRLGSRAHVLITGYVKPVDKDETELFAHVSIRTPLWRWLTRALLFVVEPFARLITKQDVRVLKRQAENIRFFSEARFMSTEIDIVHAGLTRLLKDAHAVQMAAFPHQMNRDEEPREVSEISLET